VETESDYAWIITRDLVTPGMDLPTRVGVMGPHDAPDEMCEQLKAGKGTAFRIKEDGGELCYEGRYLGPDNGDMFGPVSDFGEPDAGATEIEYRESGKWVRL
jgi:hypothetical protein